MDARNPVIDVLRNLRDLRHYRNRLVQVRIRVRRRFVGDAEDANLTDVTAALSSGSIIDPKSTRRHRQPAVVCGVKRAV
jgi:hypothetical protein